MENYCSNNWKQLFKNRLVDQVIYLDKSTDENDVVRYKLFDTLNLTMDEMINCYWHPIDQSTYVGLPK